MPPPRPCRHRRMWRGPLQFLFFQLCTALYLAQLKDAVANGTDKCAARRSVPVKALATAKCHLKAHLGFERRRQHPPRVASSHTRRRHRWHPYPCAKACKTEEQQKKKLSVAAPSAAQRGGTTKRKHAESASAASQCCSLRDASPRDDSGSDAVERRRERAQARNTKRQGKGWNREVVRCTTREGACGRAHANPRALRECNLESKLLSQASR